MILWFVNQDLDFCYVAIIHVYLFVCCFMYLGKPFTLLTKYCFVNLPQVQLFITALTVSSGFAHVECGSHLMFLTYNNITPGSCLMCLERSSTCIMMPVNGRISIQPSSPAPGIVSVSAIKVVSTAFVYKPN